MIATNAPKGTKVTYLNELEVTETVDKPKQNTAGEWFVEVLGGGKYKLDCLAHAGKHARVARQTASYA